MLVSIFGQLEYGNYSSIQDWAAAHDQAHKSLARAAAMGGNPIPGGLLPGENIDNNWMGQHGLMHMALARFLPANSTSSSTLMLSSLSEWLTESSFYDWHQRHDDIHSRLNQIFGVH